MSGPNPMGEVESFDVNLLFDDGVVTINVAPPENLTEEGFGIWCDGVNSGITAYLRVTQKNRNFINKRNPSVHKHYFKFVEPSDDDTILYFYCVRCSDLESVNRAALKKELLG